MMLRSIYRLYGDTGLASGTSGQNTVTLVGNQTSKYAAKMTIEVDTIGVYVINSLTFNGTNTVLTCDRNNPSTFSAKIVWQDWSAYLLSYDPLNKRVESKTEGEAGAIVFDNIEMSFNYMDKIEGDENPVYKVLSSLDITSSERLIIKLQVTRLNNAASSNYFMKGSDKIEYKYLYEGVVDISTVSYPYAKVSNTQDYIVQVSFEVVDKLSALNILQETNSKVDAVILYDYNTDAAVDKVTWLKWWDHYHVYIRDYKDSPSTDKQVTLANTPPIGDVLYASGGIGGSGYNFLYEPVNTAYTTKWEGFLKSKAIYPNAGDLTDFVVYDVLPNPVNSSAFYNASSDASHSGTPTDVDTNNGTLKKKNYYGFDIFVTRTITLTIRNTANPAITYDITGTTEIYAIDALKVLEAIVKQRWSDVTIVNKMYDADGNVITTFLIPLVYVFQLLDERPFNKAPLDAVAFLAMMMKAYIFFDSSGALVIQNRTSFQFIPTQDKFTVPHGTVKSGTKKLFWDKLVDAVEVTVHSWVTSGNQFVDGVGIAYKDTNIEPRNKLVVEMFASRDSLTNTDPTKGIGATYNESDGTVTKSGRTTQQIFDELAEFEAGKLMDFYGKRHEAHPMSFVGITWDYFDWDVLDIFTMNNADFFADAVQIHPDNSTLDLELISVTGYTYDLNKIVIVNHDDRFI